MTDDPSDATLFGLPLVLDNLTPSNRAYFIGPKAIANLQANGVLDEWIADGSLVVVEFPPADKD